MAPDELSFSPENFARLVVLADSGTITSTVEVFELIFRDDIDPERYVKEHGLATVNDEDALYNAVRQVLRDNQKPVEDYHNGKEKAIGFLVGQTMKAMRGKANTELVNRILREELQKDENM